MANTPTSTYVQGCGNPEAQFPGKLHDMMAFVEMHSLEHIISWVPNGHGIIVKDQIKMLEILPLFFGQTKIRSFNRQLSMWRFKRVLEGPNKGAFVHPYFLRGNKPLCAKMSRHFDPLKSSSFLSITNELAQLKSPSRNIDLAEKDSYEKKLCSLPFELITQPSQCDIPPLVSPSSAQQTHDSYNTVIVNIEPLPILENPPLLLEKADLSPLLQRRVSLSLSDTPIASTMLEALCPGMSEPASPELVESIFDELRDFGIKSTY